jgi:hypothetical protein
MTNSGNKNKELIQALSELRSECEAYSSYLDRQIDGESLPDQDPLNQKKVAVAALIAILDDSKIDDNTRASQVVNAYEDHKNVFIRKPDEFTTRLFKAIAYVVVSIATGFMFNMGRMAYRWANDSKYVGFSAGFNSEKFAQNAGEKVYSAGRAKINSSAFDDENFEKHFPTEPISNKEQKNTDQTKGATSDDSGIKTRKRSESL